MRIYETRVTQKGQVTVPAEIREKLGIKPRDLVRFESTPDGVRLLPVRLGWNVILARRQSRKRLSPGKKSARPLKKV